MHFITYAEVLFMLVESRHWYRTPMQHSPRVFALSIALNAQIYIASYYCSFISFRETAVQRGSGAHVWLRNWKGNRPNVSSQFGTEVHTGTFPEFYCPCFCQPPDGGDRRFFPSAVIFYHDHGETFAS